MIRKLSSGKYRLYSRKKNRRPGSAVIWARSRAAPTAQRHERAVQYFKRH
jgi:hypothetical protein